MASSDEAMLSAQERAALAQLEARAAADDPRLSDQLRGGQLRRRSPGRLPDAAWVTTVVGHFWASLRPSLWGPLLLVAGVAMTVATLSTSLVVAVAGVGLCAAGLALLVEVAKDRAAAAGAARALRIPDAPEG